MRYYLIVLLLLASFNAHAKQYLIYEWSSDTRIVMTEESCLVETLSGKRAALQRVTGSFIQGCWRLSEDEQTVHIDWNNPVVPNDFSEFKRSYFRSVVR